MGWLTDREEAARHPLQALAFVFTTGLVGGVAIGYFVLDLSVPWAVIVGLTNAAFITYVERKNLRDPARIEVGTRGVIRGLARLAMLFLVLLIAFMVGLATGSVNAFIVVCAAGLALEIALRLTVWR